MDKQVAKDYYSREDIQKAILKFSDSREIAIRFYDYFGKRPDSIEYLSDVKQFVSKGVSSFHCSEERWINPLLLSDKKLTDDQKTNNRSGWDLILDLDGVDFVYAKIVGKIIIDFLSELGIKNVTTKFSGNKGFHIGIPFEAFSKNIIGIGETRKLFPLVPRKIAMYLMRELRTRISSAILEYSGSIEKIAKKYNFEVSDLKIDDEKSNYLDYVKLIEIDTILIASRHLFRMPYSLNEKSGYVSIPVRNDKIMEFEREMGSVELVNPKDYVDFEFLVYNSKYETDADILLIKAYEEVDEEEFVEMAKRVSKDKRGEERGIIFTGDTSAEIFEIDVEVDIKDFPKTIDYLLNSKLDDGRKRAVFVLLTFLYSIKYKPEIIDIILKEWNAKQSTPLRDNILFAQLNWFKNRTSLISPPNYSNAEYYKSIGVPVDVLNEDISKFRPIKIKNPLHYIFILLKQRKLKEENNKNVKKFKKKQNTN